LSIDSNELVRLARQVSQQAYAKYSNFKVGSAVLSADGRTFVGCNVENSSYGLTICAERAAMFRAVSEGVTEIVAVAVYTPTPTRTPPCGACLQVLSEFADDMPIYLACDGPEVEESSLKQRLPDCFGI